MAISMGVLTTQLFAVVLAVASQDDAASTREVVLARFERLHNLIVDYKVTTKYTPQVSVEQIVQKDAKGAVTVLDTGTRITAKQFSLLHDRCMYRADDVSWDREFMHPDLKPTLERSMYARTPERSERFWGDPADARTYMGEISNYAPLPDVGEIEVGLGLRMWDAPDLMTEKNLQAMKLAKVDDGKISLQGPNHYGWPQEWLLDPALGYAVVRYRLCKRDGTITDEYTMEDFRPVDGLMLPFRVRGVCGSGIDPKNRWTTTTTTVTAYHLDDPNNTPERYHIKWPEGTHIMDIRARIGFRAHEDALRYIGDERIAQIALDQINELLAEEPRSSEVSIAVADANGISPLQKPSPGKSDERRPLVAPADVSSSCGWLWPSGVLLLLTGASGALLCRRRHRGRRGSAA